MIKILTFIGLGSFLGGVARYGVGRLVTWLSGAPTLWGTFAVNVVGCFLIGLLYGLFDRYDGVAEHWRMFLTVGFCGGFTTFSTFSLETLTLLDKGRFVMAGAYAFGSLAVCLAGVMAGRALVRMFLAAPAVS